MSQPSGNPSPPEKPQNQRAMAARRLSTRAIIVLILVAVALAHAIARILAGDERGQLELAVILLVILLASFPAMVTFFSRSRVGQFIRAGRSTTTLLKTKRLTVLLENDRNSFVVAHAFVAFLLLLIIVLVLAAVAIRWLIS